MGKSKIVAVTALLVFAVQPGEAAHLNPNHSDIHGPLSLGEFVVNCCGNSTAVAQFATQPYKGTGVQLQVTQPTACEGAFAETGIQNINGVQLQKKLTFAMSGLNDGPIPTANFSVNVSWTDPHGRSASGVFTVANGGLISTDQGTRFTLVTGTGHGRIPPGSTLNEVDFELTSTQTAFIQDVKVDRTPVHLDLTTATASCSNGS
ncbi:MAG: hypothetical protein JST89_04290 [Cyanobacteria bacterium SZAS-4]|nr:hypothetical protein [Cyanobacteria bacterium SZAS-4]